MSKEKMRIKIKATTATELCQIEKSTKASKGEPATILLKEQKVIVINSRGVEQSLYTPIFSGNGFRGALRRLSLQILIEKGIEKGFTFKNGDDFHLNNCGGGSDFQTQPFDIEDKARETNPLLSVFGTSLALSGKLKTPNLIPYKNVEDGIKEFYFAEREDGSVYFTRKYNDRFYKGDDILDRKGNAKYLSPEVSQAWQKKVEENQEDIGKTRDTDKKAKKEFIRARLGRDFVVRGTRFYTALSEMSTTQMTEVERGMVYAALELLVLENLGSNKARDFGLMEYEVTFQDGSSLETSVDEYLVASVTKREYKKEVASSIRAFNDWLENDLSEKAFEIASLFIKKQ